MKLRVVRNIQTLKIREIGKKNREKQRREKISLEEKVKKETKSPPKIFIERKDGTVEIIK